MANYNDQWPYTLTQPRAEGRYGFEGLSEHVETVLRSLEALAAQHSQSEAVICDYCARNHSSHQCTISFEPVQYGGNFGDYPNSYDYLNEYDHSWGNYPDFSGSQNNQVQTFAQSQSYTLEFQDQAPTHEERMSNLEERLSKFITLSEEQTSSQEMSIRNLENQVEQIVNAINSRHQGELSSDLVPETNGVPELNVENFDMEESTEDKPKLQLDVPKDVDLEAEEKKSGEQEKKVREDPTLNSNSDEPILIVPHVPSPPKLKNSGSFAIPCPIGSHVIGKALCDIRASINWEPWWDEKGVHEKIAEDLIVFEEFQLNNPFTDTMKQTPSYVKLINEILSKSNKLGEFETMASIKAKPSNPTWLLMDGGFLKFRRGIG